MITPTVWIDTNIIIRFLTADHPTMTQEVADLMKKVELGHLKLKIPTLIIAECCWVLRSSQYRFPPSDIAGVLTAFIASDNIEMDEKDIVLDALALYAQTDVDFVDAYLAACNRSDKSKRIMTYNEKDFRKMNIVTYRPDDF